MTKRLDPHTQIRMIRAILAARLFDQIDETLRCDSRIARKLGYSRASFWNWKTGETRMPKGMIDHLCDLLAIENPYTPAEVNVLEHARAYCPGPKAQSQEAANG